MINALVPTDSNSAMQLATMMSKGKLVPNHLRDSPGDCLMVIEQAMRWGMSPFAVAQCTSVIQGKLMFEGKLVSAALNTSGLLERRLREEFKGEGIHRSVTLTGTIKGEGQARSITVALGDAKTSNGMWAKQPDQQLIYFATRAWARRHAPEVMLGVYSPEEFDEVADGFKGATIDAPPVEAPGTRLDAFEVAHGFIEEGDVADPSQGTVNASDTELSDQLAKVKGQIVRLPTIARIEEYSHKEWLVKWLDEVGESHPDIRYEVDFALNARRAELARESG